MSDFTITLCHPESGITEAMPVSPSMSLTDCLEFVRAMLALEGNLVLVKDGQRLIGSTLQEAGVKNGDLIVVTKVVEAARPLPVPAAATTTSAAAASTRTGALDFSNLLSSVQTPSPAAVVTEPPPVYYPGMTLADAMSHNPHPRTIVRLLQQYPNLFKELNFHDPILARKLQHQPYETAVEIWRTEMVKGSIQTANAMTQSFHQEQLFQKRLAQNPNDVQAKEYFDSKRKRQLVQQQYRQAMQEYPESMGRVLMLYVEAKINDHKLQAFVDSGAQTTIMSKKCAQQCGIFDLVDTRFEGVAVGVGTGKIIGRIHIVQLQIGNTYFPCSVTVMDDMTLPTGAMNPHATGQTTTNNNSSNNNGGGAENGPKPKEMDFLLGLDMLKRHLCILDLEQGCLKFRLEPGKYLETPFLHEKDLDESKGGTKGFNAERANLELEQAQQRFEDKRAKKEEGN